ncbi:hypothetical protein HELRODRAFT_164047 [Helobdella robusta]|uniref:Uncharacterized protein n=1 Tax=Helobdella robusta TaxID=6412 RepID=T1EUT7_HELRO|nr:hypothetical protein HELRODRAFT_164047 [Helobdella robusta]ESN94242.1 hypothetical protein HELRODRAFT_164047 [Helobdella robusta]
MDKLCGGADWDEDQTTYSSSQQTVATNSPCHATKIAKILAKVVILKLETDYISFKFVQADSNLRFLWRLANNIFPAILSNTVTIWIKKPHKQKTLFVRTHQQLSKFLLKKMDIAGSILYLISSKH